MPKVSVIITTHSRPHLLPRAVKSALDAGTDVEVIVVDDASTDETAEVCQKLQGIKYIRTERNQRTAGARNLGILASSAEYISFHDDDDVRLPGSLDKQTAILEENPDLALVYGQSLVGDDDCVPIGSAPHPAECLEGDVFWEMLSRDFITCGAVVFRKACLYKVGLLEKELYRIDDWDLWVRLTEIYPIKALKEPVYIWREATPNSQQGTSNLADMFSIATGVYQQRWLKLPRAKQASKLQRREVFRKAQNWMSLILVWEGITGIRERQTAITKRNFRAIWRINPKFFFRPTTLYNIIKYSFVAP